MCCTAPSLAGRLAEAVQQGGTTWAPPSLGHLPTYLHTYIPTYRTYITDRRGDQPQSRRNIEGGGLEFKTGYPRLVLLSRCFSSDAFRRPEVSAARGPAMSRESMLRSNLLACLATLDSFLSTWLCLFSIKVSVPSPRARLEKSRNVNVQLCSGAPAALSQTLGVVRAVEGLHSSIQSTCCVLPARPADLKPSSCL